MPHDHAHSHSHSHSPGREIPRSLIQMGAGLRLVGAGLACALIWAMILAVLA